MDSEDYEIQYAVSISMHDAIQYLIKQGREQSLARIAFAAYCRCTLQPDNATQLMQVT